MALSSHRVAQAVTALVRHALERGEPVDIPEIGTFRVEHRSSSIEEQPDGTLVMYPPRNSIAFDPDTA